MFQLLKIMILFLDVEALYIGRRLGIRIIFDCHSRTKMLYGITSDFGTYRDSTASSRFSVWRSSKIIGSRWCMISNPRIISEGCSEISPNDFSNGSFPCSVRSFPVITYLVINESWYLVDYWLQLFIGQDIRCDYTLCMGCVDLLCCQLHRFSSVQNSYFSFFILVYSVVELMDLKSQNQ